MKKQLRMKFMLLLFALVAGIGNVWADQVTVSMNSFSSISGYVNNDVNVSYLAAQGTAANPPAVNNGEIRVYQNGGTFTVTSNNDAKINSITLGSSMITTVTYSVDGGTASSNQNISANSTITVNDLDCTSVCFTCTGTDKSHRLYVNSLSVIYTINGGGGSSAVATTTTINASGITNTDLKNGTAAGSLSASVTLTSGGTAVPGATVTWNGDNDAVATINSSTGAVTLVGEGDVNFTASYAGLENEYAASTSSKHKMTVTDTRYTTSTLTFTAAYSSPGATTKIDDSDDESATVTWLVSSDGTQSTYDGTKGIHYGTGSSAVKYITLSTSGISGTIKKVVVNASTANSVSATVGVTVGGSSFGGDAQSISSTATEYTFNATTTAKGQIIVTVTKPSSANGALYVKSVKVVYEPGPEISASNVDIAYDATGGSISYGIVRPVDGATLQATVADGATISSFALGAVGASPISFTCAANNESTPKTATVTLNYVKNEETLATKDVTITQGVNEAYFLTGRINFGSASGSTNINDDEITGDDSKGNTWTITTAGTSSFTPNAGYAQVGSSSNPANSITFTTTLAQSVTIADFQAKFGGFSSTAGTITLKVGDETIGTGSLSTTNDVLVVNNPNIELKTGTKLTVTVTGISRGVKCYYISYTILSYDILGEAEMTNFTIPNDKMLTIHNGGVLTITNTLTNNGNANNLIIEDGGQLIFHDNGAKDAVQATVKKNISAATNWGTESNGWNFIASPLSSNTTPASVANMITAVNTYDLYRYDGSKPKDYWENYRNEEHTDGFNLVNGQGYLYANQSDVTLEFAGTIQPSDEKEITGLNSGYNLVGNPFTCNARLNVSYYKLNATGDVISSVSVDESNPIAPCTGVIIYGPSVTFTPTTDAAVLSSGKGNVEMVLAQTVATRNGENTTTLDNAIVSFNEGSELPKFYFGTQNANIYIPMDNEEFAIVSSNGQGEMPVNFRAYVAGEYTITVNPEEVEMGYLHLIDNIAGKDVDLLANPSYTFNARTDDYESRFRLVFSTTMVNAEMGEDFAFMSDGQLVIANEGEATLQVIDVTGRVVATESINGTCSKAVNAKAGVYVLRLINGTDVKTQKMVIR